MRSLTYRERLFVDYYLGESSESAVDAGAELGIHRLKSWGRDFSRKVQFRPPSRPARERPPSLPTRSWPGTPISRRAT